MQNCRSPRFRSGNICAVEEAIPILHVADADIALAWYARLG
jgi:hypothetical protein